MYVKSLRCLHAVSNNVFTGNTSYHRHGYQFQSLHSCLTIFKKNCFVLSFGDFFFDGNISHRFDSGNSKKYYSRSDQIPNNVLP